jgi:hypothetical protein
MSDPARTPATSTPDRHRAECQELADRSAASDADEQSAPGRGRKPARAGGLWRHRPRGADWEDFDAIVQRSRIWRPTRRCWCSRASPSPSSTHADAPRVLIANSNLVPHWANWDHFNELDKKGLMMYGQMTAGSWIYIGTQGIVQGTYETFAEAGRQHYGGDLTGKWILTGGLGGMGGAQPLAAVMAGACCLAVECEDPQHRFPPPHPLSRREDRRPRRGAGDDRPLDQGGRGEIRRPARQCRRHLPRSCIKRGVRPDIVTDQTSAHDPSTATCRRAGPWPNGAKRESDPKAVKGRPRLDEGPCRSDGRLLERRRADARLRQQHPPGGQGGRAGKRLRLPRLRAGLYPPAVLPRASVRSAGRALGRPGRHLQDRRKR